MLVLGIETSGFEGSVALVRDQICLGEQQLNQVGRRHAQSLVLEIGELLSTFALTPRDVEAIAVSRGPGSFTGLRVGMTCAKTFAYATSCRFIAVDTFSAIAENVSSAVSRLFVIEDAQRDDLFVGEFSRDESGRWVKTSQIKIVSRLEFLRDRSDSDIVTGPGLKKFDPSDIRSSWFSDAQSCLPRAATIASLGTRGLMPESAAATAADTDFWQASPFYLRLSAAEEKRASLS